ncbi:hypothetical protein LPMP_080850 [Leishmania panamensis]|uniref:Chaperone protein, putative n=1 Tax=Leishmania panamensis TaxID=5679 RepID=A0A088RJ12_LEIPA|nr:hypothetical protein LPMP_080850 [Leishmania panamensis]AIN95893.1 hypothetical protein LPMP_080850 [Leishmania panamensis]
MSEVQQAAEIARLLACKARKASPFEFLQLDIATCELADVNRQYRKIALLLHPDKCQLANSTDAFHAVEKVHKSLSQEAIFYHLKRAYQRQQDRLVEEGTSATATGSHSVPAAGAATGQKRAREAETALPPIAFGFLTQLATSGLSSDAQKAAEVRRVLQCKASDYFIILDVDPSTCTVADVDRRYRRMAQALHPDKCQLPHVQEAFTVFEKAHKELTDEKKLVRFKVAFEQQRKREAALEAAAAQRGMSGSGTGTSEFGPEEGLTAEERLQKRRMEALRDQQLEAARLGEEAARRRKLKEEKEKEETALAVELERQRKEWRDLELF